MKKTVLLITIFILIFSSIVSLRSAVETTAMTFLDVIPDARSIGRGESFVAVADDAAGVNFWNPGGLGFVKPGDAGVSLTHAMYFADIGYEYLAAYLGMGKMLNFGLSFMWMHQEIEGSTIWEDNMIKDSISGNDSSSGIAFSLSYGLNLSGILPVDIGAGLSAKFASESFNTPSGTDPGESGSTVAFDLGVLAKGLIKDMSFALVAKDLGMQADYGGVKSSISSKLLIGAAMDVWKAPIRSSGGFALKKINASIDAHLMAASDPFINIGVEADTMIKNILGIQIRAGYKLLQDLGAFAGLNFGLGIGYKGLGVDYAFSSYGDLGATTRITLGYKFQLAGERKEEKLPEKKEESAEEAVKKSIEEAMEEGGELTEKDYLQYGIEGMKYYKEEKYEKAIDIWNKVPESSKYYLEMQGNIQKAKDKLSSMEKIPEEKAKTNDVMIEEKAATNDVMIEEKAGTNDVMIEEKAGTNDVMIEEEPEEF